MRTKENDATDGYPYNKEKAQKSLPPSSKYLQGSNVSKKVG